MHEVDGQRAVYAKVPAWHRIGHVLEDVFTADDALKVLEANSTGVQKYRAAVIVNGTVIEVDNFDAIGEVVDGQLRVYNFASPDYGLIQRRQHFQFLDEVVGAVDGAHYECAVSLRGGSQTIITVNLGSVTLDPSERADVQHKYIFSANSFNGSWAFRTKLTNVRAECANMAAVVLRGSTDNVVRGDWSTRHTSNIMDRVQAAKLTLGIAKQYNDLFFFNAEQFIHTSMSDNTFSRILDDLFVDATGEKDVEAQESVRGIYELSPSQLRLHGTLWGGFNAVTEYADWRSKVRGSARTNINEARFVRQLDDTRDLKQRAWDVVSQVAAVS